MYKNYESGFNNQLMSLELAVGLAYLTNRKLVYYGSGEKNQSLKPIPGVYSDYISAKRKNVVSNHRIPNIFDLMDELPIELVDYLQFKEALETKKMTIHHSEVKLVNSVFVPDKIYVNPNSLSEFADGRQIFQDVNAEVLHIHQCNLGYYSRCFYSLNSSLYEIMEAVNPQKNYRDLAAEISKNLNKFNGIHIRLTDFRSFLPQRYHSDPEKILKTLRAIIPTEELFVICTDEPENKEFFSKIISEYKNHIFLDDIIVNDFSSQFKTLPFTDEVTLGLICNLVMSHSQIFAGTPGSSFTGMIHRNWLRNKIKENINPLTLDFKYITSGFEETKVAFKDGSFLETKPGLFSWNRIELPLHTETKSWYREWVESVILPHTTTIKQQKFQVNLPVNLFPIWETGKRIQQKITNLNKTTAKEIDAYDKNNENKLLLCYAHNLIDNKATDQISKLLSEDIDWKYIIQTAQQHRILPLLYHKLKNHDPGAIPESIFKELQDYFYNNTHRTLFLTQELLRLLDIFQQNNIIAIPFKGQTLAVTAYGNLSLRMFGDLDILVQKQDMLKVQELLTTDGYVLQRKNNHLTQANHKRYLNSQYVYDEWYWKTLDHNSKFGARVEIHWITNPQHTIFPLNSEDLLQNIESVSLGGVDVPSLSPETLLVVLCLNYTKDHWTQLKMICDIATLIDSHKNMNWEKVIAQANRVRRQRTLFLGLYLAHNLLDAPIPLEIWQTIQANSEIPSLAKQISQRLFANCGCDPSLVEKTLFNFRLRETLQDKLLYIIFSVAKIVEQQTNI
ncbi:hypothetical protein AsFPU1_4020 [Aphanothece sacrum FPU1]|uniref:Uncharacterized protein n=2 Tax=Aphanothece sacrum TaxID=1122 RepID=A0A401IMU5_APHSA|nr:hypothetical protein AsFPU1_4020 [Aphanothece sacrum FPU1]